MCYILNPMDHVRIIKKLIKTIKDGTNFHGCIIEGPSGWGKTTSTEEALNKLKVHYVY